MASLSGKLAGIVLNAFNYGNHLGNTNGKINTVIDKNLGVATLNMLENIFVNFGVVILLMDIQLFPLMLKSIFSNIQEETWEWIDRHSQICKYSLDLHKCDDTNCCKPPRATD